METNSKFITIPDLVEKDYHTILLIDAEWSDIENVSFFCKSCETDFTIYLYQAYENNKEWLLEAYSRADITLINNANTKLNLFFNKLLDDKNSFYFGNKIEGKSNYYKNPIDYFVEYVYSKLQKVN